MTQPTPTPGRALRRCTHDRMVAGVASGVAEYLSVDPLLVRAAFVIAALAFGVGVPLYLAAWLLVPDEDSTRSIAAEVADRAGLD